MEQDEAQAEYTTARARRLLIAGTLPVGAIVKSGGLYLSGTGITALPDNLTVGGGLDLRGTGITALPDNLTVGGWLYLSGLKSLAMPTPWYRENGEAPLRRCIAVDESYALIEFENGTFKAGCRGPWNRDRCLKHWGGRIDERARIFTEALTAAA